jgi:glutamate racemase
MIGLFDSGVGGLSVLREIRALLPGTDLLYIADQAHAPYGDGDLGAVRDRAEAITRHLIDAGATTIVVACNTASAAALHHLRDLHPGTTFVGMEPAVKPAAAGTRTGVVGVMATPATFQSDVVAGLAARFAAGVEVVTRACRGLAAAIEEGDPDQDLVAGHVRPLVDAGADTIVIGCTHYSFVAGAIAAAAGPDITIIDPAPAVARQVARVAAGAEGSGRTDLWTTGDPARFAAQVRRLLGTEAGVPRRAAF